MKPFGWVEQTIEDVAQEHHWLGGYYCSCGHELNSPVGFSVHFGRILAQVLRLR